MPDDGKNLVWDSANGPYQCLARIDERMKEMHPRLERVERKLDEFMMTQAAHRAYFRIIAAVLALLGTGLIATVLKAFASG